MSEDDDLGTTVEMLAARVAALEDQIEIMRWTNGEWRISRLLPARRWVFNIDLHLVEGILVRVEVGTRDVLRR